MRISTALCLACVAFNSQSSAVADEASVERGLYVSIVGGCHDCHTAGYNESGGVIDPKASLRGKNIGWQGPWGTSY